VLQERVSERVENKTSMTKHRHPPERHPQKWTDSPSPISYGTRERELVRYLFQHQGERFSIRNYSHLQGIPRSTIYHYLARLQRQGYVEKPHTGNHIITQKGIDYLDLSTPPVQTPRWGCRTESLSTHYLKYHLPILSSEFHESLIASVQPDSHTKNQLQNFTQYTIKWDYASIQINTKQVVIHVHDIIAGDVDEAHARAFLVALEAAKKLKPLGIRCEGMRLQMAHYARIESHLAKTLSKMDNRYFLDLGDGEKFWIDTSLNYEDETNSPEFRKRLDSFLLDMKNSSALLSDVDRGRKDIDKLVEITYNLAQVATNMTLHHQLPNKKKEDVNEGGRPEYIG